MTAALEVIAPGLHSTVQDLGRFGCQRFGVPVAGALDAEGLALANALVGNPRDTAALEILHAGPTLAVAAEAVRVVLAGAEAEMALVGGPRIAPWRSIRLVRGERLRIGALSGSATAYLAIAGGLALAPVLGSLSTYVRGRLGGLEGRPLAAGDRLPLAAASAEPGMERGLERPPSAPQGPVRVVLGPQADHFTAEAIETLLDAEFTVSAAADRMGMRLDGPRLTHRGAYDIVSDGIATGAIQVPGSGQPIVLLADHQTTGGYPKIATVIAADLPRLGRLRPGDRLRFTAVEAAEAEQAHRAAAAALARIIARIRPAPPVARLDLAALWRENLVSGAIADDPPFD